MPLSLESLAPAATVRVPLVHPFARDEQGDPIPLDGVALTLVGPYTAEARDHFLTVADAFLATKGAAMATADVMAQRRATVRALCRAVEGLELGGVALTPADLTEAACAAHPALARMLEQAWDDYQRVQDFFDARKATSSPSSSTNAASDAA